MELKYHLLDVFTEAPFGGNQLAVFPGAEGLDAEAMQRIAGELALSETAFVLPSRRPEAAWRLRIFTPRIELPFAGHPSIGAARLLADLGMVQRAAGEARFALDEEAGLVPVRVRYDTGTEPFAELTAARIPVRGPEPPAVPLLAAMLGIDVQDIDTSGAGPSAWSAGVPFLFVPLRSVAALARARVDLDQWRTLLSAWWAVHLYLFVPAVPSGDIRARMFAPAMGIGEDPATGAAAAAIAGLLADSAPAGDDTLRWNIRQGVEMGRASLLAVAADRSGGRLTEVRVGGASVRLGDGVLRLERDHLSSHTR